MKSSQTKHLLTGITLAIAAAFGSAAYAQTEGQAVSRADVKAQARAANMAGQIAAGELAMSTPMPASTRTREQRKAETLAAARNGGLGSNGLALYRANVVLGQQALAHSTKTRDERKAETLQAARDHKLPRPGELS